MQEFGFIQINQILDEDNSLVMLSNTYSNFGLELFALCEVIKLLLILPWFPKLSFSQVISFSSPCTMIRYFQI